MKQLISIFILLLAIVLPTVITAHINMLLRSHG